MKKLLIGGSPCTHWSIAQHNGRETEASGIGWELFKCYLAAKEKFKPDYFLYENNRSASEAIKEQISRELGAPLHYINSALVSAQNRQRFYVHNFGDIGQPADRGIVLDDILDSSEGEQFYKLAHVAKGASYCVACRGRYKEDGKIGLYMCPIDLADYTLEKDAYHVVKDGKIETRYGAQEINLPDGAYVIRKLKPVECERLQTMPDGYTEGVADSQRYKALGNGWTAEVIKFILSHIDAEKDEPIVVLSMFDGIATGRYVLESLGYTNVTYYAYEIDEPAKTIALKNYPDIIQLGDAFNLHREDWELGKLYDTPAPAKPEPKQEACEETDLSDAPEEIKETILKNDELLRAKEAPEKTEQPTATLGTINATERLRKLANERKTLADLHPDDDRFAGDVIAIEYAVGVLEAMGL
jgi:DNA (cytosine-5)-methyltransferase 3A